MIPDTKDWRIVVWKRGRAELVPLHDLVDAIAARLEERGAVADPKAVVMEIVG